MNRMLCLRQLVPQTFLKNACFNASKCLQIKDRENRAFVTSQRCASSMPKLSNRIIVYKGRLCEQIRLVKIFSLSTSMGGLIAQPLLIQRASEVAGTPLMVAMFGFVGFFTLVTPIMLHLLTRRYVFELYYDTKANKYSARIMNFFLRKKYIDFTPDDVKTPEVGGMFTTFIAKGKPLYVDPGTFKLPEHYVRIMGYDKPINLRVNEKVTKEK